MAVSDADAVPQQPTQLISLPNPATLAEKKRKKRARTMRWRKMKRLRKHLAAGTIIYFTYFFQLTLNLHLHFFDLNCSGKLNHF
jgi:hypothetical protein